MSAIIRSSTSGVNTRQIASLTRKAEKKPEVATIAVSKINERLARAMTQTVAKAKKPESRKLATTIIMPSSSAMVSRSTALLAS